MSHITCFKDFLTYLLSFFLLLTFVYLFIVDVQGNYCTWSHSVTKTHPLARTSLKEGSARRRDAWQNTTLTRYIHAPGGIPTRDPRQRAAADPRLTQRGHKDRLKDFHAIKSDSYSL